MEVQVLSAPEPESGPNQDQFLDVEHSCGAKHRLSLVCRCGKVFEGEDLAQLLAFAVAGLQERVAALEKRNISEGI